MLAQKEDHENRSAIYVPHRNKNNILNYPLNTLLIELSFTLGTDEITLAFNLLCVMNRKASNEEI